MARSLQVKKFSCVTRIGIVCVQRGAHYLLTSSLPFIKKINEVPCSCRLIYLSGTIRGCLKFLRAYYKKQMREFEGELGEMRRRGVTELSECLRNERVEERD